MPWTADCPRAAQGEDALAFAPLADMIEKAGSIALSGHTNPDGDSIGSVVALADAIEARWPGKEVRLLLADNKPLPGTYSFLPHAGRFEPACGYTGAPDLFIALDTPTEERLGESAAVMRRARATAQIDHHPARGRLADVCCVVPEAASTGDIVFEFMRHIGASPSVGCATALLTAVVTDTGRFQYQNADPHALEVAAHAVAAGASCHDVCARVYQNDPLPALKMRARALDRLEVDPTGRIAYSFVTLEDLGACGAGADDCEGLVDDVRCLGGVDAVLFLRQTAEGSSRGNLRSKVDWLDVAAVAARFGGGGHRAAAGFTIQADPVEALGPVLGALREAIESCGRNGL